MPDRLPNFITFTGADDWADIDDMRALARRYPIEWGILFSPSRQGVHPRYPGGEAQSRFAWSGLRLAAHLCGGHSNAIMTGAPMNTPVDFGIFDRIQINHAEPLPDRISAFRRGWGPRCIAQCRIAGALFPRDTSIDWLYDPSGGRGVAPPSWSWPTHPGGNRLVGYAGGISPTNVRAVIAAINAAGPYWIDMESGVRDADDRFDIDRCTAVCAAVYGEEGLSAADLRAVTPPNHRRRAP